MKIAITYQICLLSLLLTVLASCNNPTVRKERANVILPIVPQPKEVRVYEGSFVLDSNTQLIFSTEEQGKVASLFNKELQNAFGLSCPIGTVQEEKNSIVLTQDDSLANETYLLAINDDKIAIKASS